MWSGSGCCHSSGHHKAAPRCNGGRRSGKLAVVIDRGGVQCCYRIQHVRIYSTTPDDAKNSHRNNLNACHASLVCNRHCFLCPDARRPIGYDDQDPRRHRSSSGVRLEGLVACSLDSGSQVVASITKVADAEDALLS